MISVRSMRRLPIGLLLSMVVLIVLSIGSVVSAQGYVIGYSAPYLTPRWMQQTTAELEQEIDRLKALGIVSEMIVGNANADTSLQIAQIQGMIDRNVDAIILVAGSATALNPVVERAHEAGIVVVNFDSLVTTEQVTSKVGMTWSILGTETAEWLAEAMGYQGNIIAVYGPAGVSVAEDLRSAVNGVVSKYSGLNVVAEVRADNPAPAEIAVANALAANPQVDGIYAFGWGNSAGALRALVRANRPMIPIVGENYNAFLMQWDAQKSKGLSALATGEPNDISVLSLHIALKALAGETVPTWVEVPRPNITNDTLGEYVPNDEANDNFLYTPMTQAEIDAAIAAALAE